MPSTLKSYAHVGDESVRANKLSRKVFFIHISFCALVTLQVRLCFQFVGRHNKKRGQHSLLTPDVGLRLPVIWIRRIEPHFGCISCVNEYKPKKATFSLYSDINFVSCRSSRQRNKAKCAFKICLTQGTSAPCECKYTHCL